MENQPNQQSLAPQPLSQEQLAQQVISEAEASRAAQAQTAAQLAQTEQYANREQLKATRAGAHGHQAGHDAHNAKADAARARATALNEKGEAEGAKAQAFDNYREARDAMLDANGIHRLDPEARKLSGGLVTKEEAREIARHDRNDEIQKLNDEAERRLFGTQRRVYVGEDGKPISDKDNTKPGFLDGMLTNTAYGATLQERQAARASVENTIQALTDRGLELCQAEVIVREALNDFRTQPERVQELIDKRSESRMTQAEKQALAAQAEVDIQKQDAYKSDKRLQIITDNDLMSRDEYEAFLKSKAKGATAAAGGAGGAGGNGGNGGGPKDPNDTRGSVEDVWEEAHKADQLYEEFFKKGGREKLGKDLQIARDAYIRISASQRSSHIGRLEARDGGRLKAFIRDKVARGMWRKSQSNAADTEFYNIQQAHENSFRRAYSMLATVERAIGRNPNDTRANLLGMSINELARVEHGVTNVRTQNAEQEANAYVSKLWGRSRASRYAAAVAGGGVLGAVSAMGLPALLLAVPAWGRKMGFSAAAITNRTAGMSGEAAEQRIEVGAANLRKFFSDRASLGAREFDIWADIHGVQGGRLDTNTTEQIYENQRRRGHQGAYGLAAAAGGAILGMTLVGAASPVTGTEGSAVGNVGAQGTVTGAEAPVNPNIPAVPSGVETNAYPWELAHQATPGSEMATIQDAANVYNQAHGANMHLVNVGDTVQLYDGTHALNVAQQAQFNAFMANYVGGSVF